MTNCCARASVNLFVCIFRCRKARKDIKLVQDITANCSSCYLSTSTCDITAACWSHSSVHLHDWRCTHACDWQLQFAGITVTFGTSASFVLLAHCSNSEQPSQWTVAKLGCKNSKTSEPTNIKLDMGDYTGCTGTPHSGPYAENHNDHLSVNCFYVSPVSPLILIFIAPNFVIAAIFICTTSIV